MGKILIVEDHKITRSGLIKIAKNSDKTLEVIATGYASEAFNYANNNQFDAFFLDIQLIDYSGIELAKQIRKIENYMFTPIIFITAIPTRELEAFKQIHCYDYLVKPFSEKEVEEVFEKIIKNYMFQIGREPVLKLERKGFINIIKQKDIMYLELKDRKIWINTINEKFYYSGQALSKMSFELSDDFIQIHQAFIINKRFIKYINLQINENVLQ